MPSTTPTTLLATLTTAVCGRRIAFLHARLPGLLECALLDEGAPLPVPGDDPPPLAGTLMLSLRAGAVGIAVLEAGRAPHALIPADVAGLARGEALRSRDARAEMAALREAATGAVIRTVRQWAPAERIVAFTLDGADGQAWDLVVELLPRGGRVLMLEAATRVVRVVVDAPGGSRVQATLGEPYSPPPPRADATPVTLDVADAAALALAHGEALRADALAEARSLASRAGKRLRQRADACRAALADCAHAATFRRRAETLLAHLGRVKKGEASVTLPDVYGDGEVTLTLDTTVSPRENAERLFRRARKLERAEPLEAARLAEVEAMLADLATSQDALDAATRGGAPTLADIHAAADGVIQVAKRAGIEVHVAAAVLGAPKSGAKSAVPQTAADDARIAKSAAFAVSPGARAAAAARRKTDRFAPRKYRTREGWEVWVGRNNEENDHLTHKMARQDDLWFHVHGAAGSHVVLRREGRKDNPPKSAIEEAAQIAAFFSKASGASKAPVIYTEKRYVRKPRKSPAGLAQCTHEKMIMVAPREPRDDQKIVQEDGV